MNRIVLKLRSNRKGNELFCNLEKMNYEGVPCRGIVVSYSDQHPLADETTAFDL